MPSRSPKLTEEEIAEICDEANKVLDRFTVMGFDYALMLDVVTCATLAIIKALPVDERMPMVEAIAERFRVVVARCS